MNSQVRSEIKSFAGALRQSEVVRNYLTARSEATANGQFATFISITEGRTSAGDQPALNQLLQTAADEPPLRHYLQTRTELVMLLQEINKQISSGIGFNIAGSLGPSSCCG